MDIEARIKQVRQRIAEACIKANRGPQCVRLVAVSKTKPVEMIEKAYKIGIQDFGENYVQEFVKKYDALTHLDIRWHFIGTLQSNKVKYIANKVCMIHSVDRESQIKEIDKRFEKPVDVLIEVNIGHEPNKSGVLEDDLFEFALKVANSQKARLRGLMCIPPAGEDSTPYFKKMVKLLEETKNYLRQQGVDITHIDQLSMGMSGDFEQAIQHGATIIRVGTSIFGPRS